jgi:uncharacterized repeat protein (TIGR01451 family)
MLRKYLAASVLALVALTYVAPARAQQTPPNPDEDKSIGDRLGDFGRSIKGLFVAPDSKPTPAANANPSGGASPPANSTWTGTPTPSRFAAPPADASTSAPPRGIATESVSRQQVTNNLSDGYVPGVGGGTGNGLPMGMLPPPPIQPPPTITPPDDHSVGYSVAGSDDRLKSGPNAATEVIPVPRKITEIRPETALAQNGTDSMSLHQRMAAFRQSPFDSGDAAGPSAQTPQTTQSLPATQSPAVPNRDDGNSPLAAQVTAPNTPMTAQSSAYTPAASQPSYPQRVVPSYSSSDTVIDGPSFSSPVNPAPAPFRAAPVIPNPALAGPGPSTSTPVPSPSPADSASPPTTSTSVSPSPSFNASTASLSDRNGERQSQGVLLSRQSPNLSVETVGPRRIAVGREAHYEVTMRNTGSVAAEELLVIVELPTWADVQRAEASLGSAQQTAGSNGMRQLLWRIGRLEAQTFQRLTLKLVPRESRPLGLGIHWDYKQISTQTVIEVQEPRLALRIEGPREVLYGKKQIYKLKVANTGSGDADNTAIQLLPLGTSESVVAHHTFGTIAAGAEKSIEVEMTARQSGLLTIKVEAQCEGGSRAEIAEPVLVRRAALVIRVEAPKIQFVGSVAVYRIHVTNPGNATANNLLLSATIPPGAKLISASDAGQTDSQGTIVRWRIDSLNATAEKSLDLKCSFQQEGTARLDVAANAEDDLSVAANAATQIDAMANLVLDVTDPVGPIPVGDETAYELRVANRGTKSAEEVEVLAFFSQGIEPTTVEGGPHKIAPGQVTFDTIPSIGPGQELRLKINARAQIPGSHIFRAEVHCRPLSTRLVREETTYFYANQSAPGQDLGVAGPEKKSADADPLRNADRRATVPAMGAGVPDRSYR